MGDVVELKEFGRKAGMKVFAMGDLLPALEQGLAGLDGLLDTLLSYNGEYYEPPVSFNDLTKLLRANAHHESAIFCKVTTVVQGYRPGAVPVVSRRAIEAVCVDYVYTGNAYLQKIADRTGRVRQLRHLHARAMRRGKDPDVFMQINGPERIRFQPGEVIHIRKYSPESSIYGLPEYLGAIKSLLLNESATLFRNLFYRNGAHAGFILVTSGGDFDDEDVKALKERIEDTRGSGNFKSLYVDLPSAQGGEAKMELIRVGDFAKDDFDKVKTISRDDIISAHRVPPQILAVLTDNKLPITGDLDKIAKLYNRNVVRPIQLDIEEAINENVAPDQAISFDPYVLTDEGEAAQDDVSSVRGADQQGLEDEAG